MTTINIKSKRSKGMQLNGNVLSGDTFPMKDYIKAYCGGKWNAEAKAWIVDTEKIMGMLNTPGAQISIDETPAENHTTRANNGWCNKCHSYCFGDCEAH